MTNKYTYRLETPLDYDSVEGVIRDAFWNVYQPGCDEHFIVHKMRHNPAAIECLNYVCVDGGIICGHIFYTKTKVVSDSGQVFPVISFGPISVLPSYQRKGIGSTLIRLTLDKAAKEGFSGALIVGNPKYYHRFGFRPAADFKIVADDGSSFPELMAYELGEGRLKNIHGRLFFCPEFTNVNQNEVLEFDRNFPPKKRLKLPGQLFSS